MTDVNSEANKTKQNKTHVSLKLRTVAGSVSRTSRRSTPANRKLPQITVWIEEICDRSTEMLQHLTHYLPDLPKLQGLDQAQVKGQVKL